jgi:CBS domain-containing protein
MHVMARDVFCVTPDLPVDVVADLLLDTDQDEVAVVSPTGVPIGVVGKADLVGGAPAGGRADTTTACTTTFTEHEGSASAGRTAQDVMRPVPTTLHYRTSIATAAAIQVCRGSSRVVVVDDDGAICGIVTAQDLAAVI